MNFEIGLIINDFFNITNTIIKIIIKAAIIKLDAHIQLRYVSISVTIAEDKKKRAQAEKMNITPIKATADKMIISFSTAVSFIYSTFRLKKSFNDFQSPFISSLVIDLIIEHIMGH